MFDRIEFIRLIRQNRDLLAELEDHLDQASTIFYRIAGTQIKHRDALARSIEYPDTAFVGISGDDMAIIETEAKMLYQELESWNALRYKMTNKDKFCSQEPAFIDGLHSVCITEGNCLTGDALREDLAILDDDSGSLTIWEVPDNN